MRPTRTIVWFVAALTLSVPTHARADLVDDASQNFLAGRYDLVFKALFPYRINNEGTLRVDFMLAVSACQLPNRDFKALGGFLLAKIPQWYTPLQADQLAVIGNQAGSCPWTGITEQQAISKAQAKGDNATHFAPQRSSSGKDQPLPPAPAPAAIVPPPASMMGPLVDGLAYLQADYRDARVPSAAACSALCAREARCLAMTYIVNQQRCWLKSSVPATANAPGMISSAKMVR